MSFYDNSYQYVENARFVTQLSGDISYAEANIDNPVAFNLTTTDTTGGWNTSLNKFIIKKTFANTSTISFNVLAYLIDYLGYDVDVTVKLWQNNILLYNSSYTIEDETNHLFNASVSNISLVEGDQVYVTINWNAAREISTKISDDNTNFSIIEDSTASNIALIATSSYWGVTSSALIQTSGPEGTIDLQYYTQLDNILTASIQLQQFYDVFNQNNKVAGTTLNSGFSDPLLFNIQPNDEFRFGGSENNIYTVVTASQSLIKKDSGYVGNLWVQLDKNPSNVDPNYFVIRRLTDDPGFIMINTQDSQGPGFILPKYPSSTLKENFSNIVQDLASKNLLL